MQLTFSFVIAELVPNRARPVVNAGIFVTTLPFSAFGSLIADLFIANTARSWRWTYYLNIITCGLSIILLVLFYFPPGWDAKRGNESRVDGLKKFDYIGFLLYAGGLILVLLGLCESPFQFLLGSCKVLTRFSVSMGWHIVCLALSPCRCCSGHRIRLLACFCSIWYVSQPCTADYLVN